MYNGIGRSDFHRFGSSWNSIILRTVNNLDIGTGTYKQTVQTRIRLRIKEEEESKKGLRLLSFQL